MKVTFISGVKFECYGTSIWTPTNEGTMMICAIINALIEFAPVLNSEHWGDWISPSGGIQSNGQTFWGPAESIALLWEELTYSEFLKEERKEASRRSTRCLNKARRHKRWTLLQSR